MNFNNISSWSIRNPIPVVLLFVVLTIAGISSYFNLRTNKFPDVDQPIVAVTVVQPGAAPTELETQVTRLVEDSLAGLGRVRKISSTVTDSASTTKMPPMMASTISWRTMTAMVPSAAPSASAPTSPMKTCAG